MATVIAVVAQKGGTAKTTTCLNLADALARKGKNVLLVDLDPQAHLSRTLGAESPGLLDALLNGNGFRELIQQTALDGVSIIPAAGDMSGADISLASEIGREVRLRKALNAPAVRRGFGFTIIDTAPSLGLLTLNAIVAAQWILVPLPADFMPLAALASLEETLAQVTKNVREARFKVLGYLLTMYDRRESAMREDVENILIERYGKLVFPLPIRVNSNIKAAVAQGTSVLAYERGKGRGSEDFMRLAAEVIKRI